MGRILPRYPVYVPSKGRSANPLTIKFLLRDDVPFYVVVEPQEVEAYRKVVGDRATMLVLPWSGNDAVRQAYCAAREIENGGLIAARNWIKEHSATLGAKRHWQLDDNIREMLRRTDGMRLPCRSGVAFAAMEDFVDRYDNVAIAGANYYMFAPNRAPMPPFYLNVHVYSCTLILNKIPQKWRLAYNDDTDICLQVLSAGWCTVLFNAFLCQKIKTMTAKGGNTDDLYQGDGRLKMARSLERMWPGVVRTERRFQRPQHVVLDNWKRFDTPLVRRAGVEIPSEPNNYGMKLTQVKDIVKSEDLRRMLSDANADQLS